MTPYLKILKAAEENNTRELHILNGQYPDLLHRHPSIWEENPLRIACKHGSLQFVKELIELNPFLAKRRDSDGFSPMHVASAYGHVEIVQALTEFDSTLCFLEDMNSRIPLHVAAMKGKEDVVRALVMACPASLRAVTSERETSLHLSLKHNRCSAFRVLMEGVNRFGLREILNWKDYEGNTVLHIATSHKLIKILEQLLSNNSTNGVRVDVNSINERGYTSLDVNYENSNELTASNIGHILRDAGAVEGCFLPNHTGQSSSSRSGKKQSSRMSMKARNVLLTVFVTVATLFLTASWNPPNVFELQNHDENGSVNIWDLVLGPNQFVATFYYMMFSIAGFIATMGAIQVLVWPFHLRTVMTFVLVTLVMIYILLVDKIMPRFFVILGSSHISSIIFVWLSATAFISCGVTIWLLAKLFDYICKNRQEAMHGELLV